jgi:hypothetical protein
MEEKHYVTRSLPKLKVVYHSYGFSAKEYGESPIRKDFKKVTTGSHTPTG